MRSVRVLVISVRRVFCSSNGVLRRLGLTFAVGDGQVFAVPRIGLGLGFVPCCLAGLGQQNQRCGVRRLQAERQVEQDEGVGIEVGDARHVEKNPYCDDQRLRPEKHRRAEEPRKGLGAQGKLVSAEGRRQVSVRTLETQVIDGRGGFGFGGHDALCSAGLRSTIAPLPGKPRSFG